MIQANLGKLSASLSKLTFALAVIVLAISSNASLAQNFDASLIQPFDIGMFQSFEAGVNNAGGGQVFIPQGVNITQDVPGGISSSNGVVNIISGNVGDGSTANESFTEGAIINIFGGSLDRVLGGTFIPTGLSSSINVFGGQLDNVDNFGQINLVGGSFGSNDPLTFDSNRTDVFDIFGTQFSVDGVAVNSLEPGDTFFVNISQPVEVTGFLADGSAFNLTVADRNLSFTDSDVATFSLGLNQVVPEPSSATLLMLGGCWIMKRRRRRS